MRRHALGDDPAPDRKDLAGLLGELEELAGEVEQVALGLPAEERLDPDRRSVVEVDDGLEVELQLVPALGAAEERGELAARGGRVEQLLAEGDHLAATRGLRGIHRDVGVPEQVLARRAVGTAQRVADARAHDRRGVVELDRLDDPLEEAVADQRDVARTVDVLEQDRELVAAEPARGVARPDDRPDAVGNDPERAVALRVPEPIVQVLEVVEVDEQDRGVVRAAAAQPGE